MEEATDNPTVGQALLDTKSQVASTKLHLASEMICKDSFEKWLSWQARNIELVS